MYFAYKYAGDMSLDGMRSDNSLLLGPYIKWTDPSKEKWLQTCAYEYGLNKDVPGIAQWPDAYYYCLCNYKPERKWSNLDNEVLYDPYNCDTAYNW